MQRFNIYKKSKKFHWSYTSTFFSIIILLYLAYFIKNNFYSLAKGLSEDPFLKTALLCTFILLVLKSIGLVKPKSSNEELNGFLEFYKDYIIIDQEKFNLEEIKSIEINNNDYYGKPDIGYSLSNGTNNQISLRFNSGKTKSYNFELYNEYDMGKVEDELFFYYSNGKIDFFELVKILKIKSKTEIEEFRTKISLLK